MYEIYITDNNLVPTTCQMDRAIRSFWRKEDLWFEREYLVPVPSYKHILEATQSDSMDQYWKDIQPSKKKRLIVGKQIKRGTVPYVWTTTALQLHYKPASVSFITNAYADGHSIVANALYAKHLYK